MLPVTTKIHCETLANGLAVLIQPMPWQRTAAFSLCLRGGVQSEPEPLGGLSGVVCEMVYGKTHGKLVYVMYPYEPSPFLEYYSHRIFKNEDQFLAFLKRIAS